MCGILGFMKKGAPTQNGGGVADEMIRIQRHRGPDDNGKAHIVCSDVDGYLGFNRLSILDLSSNGHQPMVSADGSVTLIFNGEIYNAFSYREELEQKGYTFASHTDTEVVLHLYQEYGFVATLERLRGMFAIAIFDQNTGRLYMARDRFGEKPFVYYHKGDLFLFASEAKTFYAHPDFKPELNRQALDEYFMFRYIAGEETLLEGVKNLLPGHYMEYCDGKLSIQPYYTQQIKVERRPKAQIYDGFINGLKASVKEQLISDVPIGIMLSGGVDSSVIAKYVSEEADLQSFSIIFNEPGMSEEQWMDHVTNQLGIHPNKYVLSADDFLRKLQRCIYHYDAPLNHPNSIGVYLLCGKAKEKVTVMLGGEGSDELLCGYSVASTNCRYRFIKRFVPKPFRGIGPMKRIFKGENNSDSYYIKSSAFIRTDVLKRLKPDVDIDAVVARRQRILDTCSKGNTIHRYSVYDQKTYLVDILNRNDKMSMAQSMELRAPFLSYTFNDYVRTMPSKWMLRLSLNRKNIMKSGKYILKEICADIFGEEFTYRSKMGFPVPMSAFFTDPAMAEFITGTLMPTLKARGILDADYMDYIWQHVDERVNAECMWVMIAFEIWAELFIDGGIQEYICLN